MSDEILLDKIIEQYKHLAEIYPDSLSIAASLEDYQDLKISNAQRKIAKTSLRSSKKEKTTAKTS
jgi:hypothetical protein